MTKRFWAARFLPIKCHWNKSDISLKISRWSSDLTIISEYQKHQQHISFLWVKEKTSDSTKKCEIICQMVGKCGTTAKNVNNNAVWTHRKKQQMAAQWAATKLTSNGISAEPKGAISANFGLPRASCPFARVPCCRDCNSQEPNTLGNHKPQKAFFFLAHWAQEHTTLHSHTGTNNNNTSNMWTPNTGIRSHSHVNQDSDMKLETQWK